VANLLFINLLASKVLLFHATDEEFTEFESGVTGTRGVGFSFEEVISQGFFFMPEEFADEHADDFGDIKMRVYVRMEKPLFTPQGRLNLGDLPKQQERDIAYVMSPPLFKENDDSESVDDEMVFWSLTEPYFVAKKNMINSIEEVHDDKDLDLSWIYDLLETDGINWQVLDCPGITNRMKELGYDETYVDEDWVSSILSMKSSKGKPQERSG
jgi:hypothetical protein